MIPKNLRTLIGNRIFSCIFTKRTTGETRLMVARLNVKSYLKGGEPTYDFQEKGLLPVFDMQKKEYRCIPLEGIKSLTVKGVTYTYRGRKK